MTEGADMLNEVAAIPGVTFGLHICKGNYDSHWISAGGYGAISKQLFGRLPNDSRLLLEYENERSGSFEPLADVPDDKVVVLGLVSSKFDELESAEAAAGQDRRGRRSSIRASSSRCRRNAASRQPARATRSARTRRRRSCG